MLLLDARKCGQPMRPRKGQILEALAACARDKTGPSSESSVPDLIPGWQKKQVEWPNDGPVLASAYLPYSIPSTIKN